MAKARGVPRKAKIETLKHKDKRANIPTEELRDFVVDEEKTPRTVLYPRDPSLDPQLVWSGKDEQDSKPLAVPAVPVYIQEKIHPQAIIEDLRVVGRGEAEPQLQLYADFNGLPEDFSKRVDFYHWDQNWSNRMILGDSLLVMTSLAEKEGLKGKVQMIYIDPPYGIKFGSNWQVSTRKRDVKDGKAEGVNREPEVVKAFRDTWVKGIHSYLAYLRDRLRVAHGLLTESGSVFVQISEENIHIVRSLLDEVFGSQNFVSQISYATTGGFDTSALSRIGDYLLWYCKDIKQLKYRQLYVEKGSVLEQQKSKYDQVQLADGMRRRIGKSDKDEGLPVGALEYRLDNMFGQGSADQPTPFVFEGHTYEPPNNNHWKPNYPVGLSRLATANRIQATGESLAYVRFLADLRVQPITNVWTDISGTVQSRSQGKIFVVQTSTSLLERCLLMTTDPGDLVLDPTCGSGTTAYVAEQWGRRWITIDASRVALALARGRLMAGWFSYYLLVDSPEGTRKLAELTGIPPNESKTEGDVKKGFVYERVPHVTLKAIAKNEQIDAIHAKWREKLEPLRNDLNKALKQNWEEWQVPREADASWPKKAKEAYSEWWQRCRERQEEIDGSIAAHADIELLCDQPYPDSGRMRVTGPFTVESLSPHRVIAAESEAEGQGSSQPASEREASAEASSKFIQTILDNLKKAGVQNYEKRSRLNFDRLGPYAGVCINAAGEYSEGGKTKRVAVSIGPEFGTVGPDLVKEAAKEAVQGIGFDLLIVCGFAFDPHVNEEAKRYGKLPILVTRMNPDLAMGDELLKKTGAGNLFMVFGEPDIEIKPEKDGNLVVKIKGVDVYDPTTGQIRNSSTDDIACWFIDTNYNSESFFVRHAYFTGAGDPYRQLKKALRAEIDQEAWSSLHSTVSRPFPKPKANGKGHAKIAVKVINHYGDEVMKVYAV